MPFKIESTEKKNVSEKCVWEKVLKNGKRIVFEEEVWYRWGEVWVTDDPRENGWQPDEPLNTDDYNRVDHNLTDGCYSDRYGVEDLSKKEQKLLNEATWPEDAEWECVDCEIVFYDGVEITEE